MNIISFTAKTAPTGKSTEDMYYMVGFSDGEYDYRNYIVLQRSFKECDNYSEGEYIELNGQDNSGYNAVVNAILDKNEFVVNINSRENGISSVKISLDEIELSSEFKKYIVNILGNKLTIK